jgi:hypothetical protein
MDKQSSMRATLLKPGPKSCLLLPLVRPILSDCPKEHHPRWNLPHYLPYCVAPFAVCIRIFERHCYKRNVEQKPHEETCSPECRRRADVCLIDLVCHRHGEKLHGSGYIAIGLCPAGVEEIAECVEYATRDDQEVSYEETGFRWVESQV